MMKYTRLTKEQFEALTDEFSKYLAVNSIDKSTWDDFKAHNQAKVDEHLDLFSDLIWDKVLNQTNYIEHFSKHYIFLFKCFEAHVESIVVRHQTDHIDLMTTKGLQWMIENLASEEIEIIVGNKPYEKDRNLALFELIQQGAILSNGELYNQLKEVIVT